MTTKTELVRLRETLSALFDGVQSGFCTRCLVIGINSCDASDPLVAIQYPENEREAFREQLIAMINARMGDS